MTRKSLLAASLFVPLIAMSGAAYAGPQWNPTMPPWNQARSASQPLTSKPYAEYVGTKQISGKQSTGPKLHYERR